MTRAAPVDMQDIPVGIGRGELDDETTAGARADNDCGGARHSANGAVSAVRPLIGRYRLIEPLGRGGMGRVYRGLDERLDRPVAVKLIYDDDVSYRDQRHACAVEALVAARLNHPGIVQVLDSGFDDGRCFVVMELAAGRTLAELLREGGALPVERALGFAAQVADALDEAHRQGMVHCDVKPGNLIIDEDDRVRLIDFGIARVASSASGLGKQELHGSARYVAPEQVEGAPIDGRTDLYSLGVVLFEMLTGRPPFVGVSVASTLAQRLAADPPPLRPLVAAAPPEVEQIVRRALAREPDGRFRTAGDLRDALQATRQRVADARTVSLRTAVASEAGRPVSRIASLASVAARVGFALGPLPGAGRALRTWGRAPRPLGWLGSPLASRFLRTGLAGMAIGGLMLGAAAAQHRAPEQAIEPAEVAQPLTAHAVTLEPPPTPSPLPPTVVAAEVAAEPTPTAPMPAEPTPTAPMPAEPMPTPPAPTAAPPTPEPPVAVAPVRRAPAPPTPILAPLRSTPTAPEPPPARRSAADETDPSPTEQVSPPRDDTKPGSDSATGAPACPDATAGPDSTGPDPAGARAGSDPSRSRLGRSPAAGARAVPDGPDPTAGAQAGPARPVASAAGAPAGSDPAGSAAPRAGAPAGPRPAGPDPPPAPQAAPPHRPRPAGPDSAGHLAAGHLAAGAATIAGGTGR